MAQELIDKIQAQAQARGLDPAVAVRIAQIESSMNPSAKAKTSTAGGLFQVVDETWKQFGGKPGQKNNPDENIRVGLNILEANTKSLREALGRDPSPSELYAAHFLGAQGARTLLTASPDTPVEQLLSARAIKANSSMLKGKNAGELIGVFEQKMGMPVQAQAVAKPTPAAPMPASAAGAPKRVAEAPVAPVAPKAAGMGTGYQAALALAFLGDEEEKAEKGEKGESDSAAKMMAAYKPYNALKDFDLGPSVFAQLPLTPGQAQAQPQQPKMMAEGGEVGDPNYVSVLERGDMSSPAYRAQLEREQGLELSTPELVVAPMVKGAVTASRAALDKYVNAKHGPGVDKALREAREFDAWNKLTAEQKIGYRESNPLARPPEFYKLLESGEASAIGSHIGRMEMPGSVAARRTPQENMERLARKLLLHEVRPVVNRTAVDMGLQVANQMQDAYRRYGSMSRAEVEAHELENLRRRMQGLEPLPPPVKRQEGSPETGEEAKPTPEELEAASRPAFLTPKSGIGRRQSMTSGQVNDAVLAGVAQTPYNLLGAPVDLTALAMTPFGYSNPTPVMGSEWIKQKMTEAGVRPATPTQPTQRAAYEMGQFGAGLTNPAAVVRGAANAVSRSGQALRNIFPTATATTPGTQTTTPVVEGSREWIEQQFAQRRAAQAQNAVAAPAPAPAPVAAAPTQLELLFPTSAPAENAAQMLAKVKKSTPGKQPTPIFTHSPTAEAPFVGRLDEFVASLPGAVQKDQFLGQLKGKFREQDIARAEGALQDLPANAKLTPSDLLNRLKSRYDPANMRTTVLPPKDKSYFPAQDNPYWDKPVGVIHLSSYAEPALLERVKKAESLNTEFSNLRSLEYEATGFPKIAQVAQQDPQAAQKLDEVIRMREQTQEHLRPLIEGRLLMQAHDYPILSSNFNQRQGELREAYRAAGHRDPYNESMEAAKASIKREAADALVRMYGRVPVTVSELKALVANKIGDRYDDWAKQGKILEEETKKAADDLRTFLLSDPQRFGIETPYKGKSVHSTLNPPPNAAAFTRFVEQTVRDPDRGQLKGIHLLEIQSDLTSELKAGKNAGLKEKEVFPNMAENRRVVQQLGMKNAIAAAINRGDQFVTFPGAESAKPKLYESLHDNLKAVSKDLGPGFEIRPFTFTSGRDNKEIQHWGITWGPEAAARIQKQGVPFKDGGMVERNPADSRKYL